MPENPSLPAEPDWVRAMRAEGWTVRTGTDPTPLPFEPEVDFSLPRPLRPNLSRRMTGLVRKLWPRRGSFRRRMIGSERHHAPVP
jgi:hypothetical protein